MPWRKRRMLPASRSAARACLVNPGEAGRGASGKVEKGGADAVPPPQEDEGSSAQESADVEENGARASPLRVWSFSSGSCQPLQARRPVPPRRKAAPGETKRQRQLLRGVPEPGFYVEARPSGPSVERPESRAPVAGVFVGEAPAGPKAVVVSTAAVVGSAASSFRAFQAAEESELSPPSSGDSPGRKFKKLCKNAPAFKRRSARQPTASSSSEQI
eukprot:COSAG06_NODE_5694_length_3315_cov_196.563433_2_plen_216_part_00